MQHPGNGSLQALDQLGTLKVDLEIDAVVTKLHPTKPSVTLRVGMDKKGHLHYYEFVGNAETGFWSQSTVALADETKEDLQRYGSMEKIVALRGTGGIMLFHRKE